MFTFKGKNSNDMFLTIENRLTFDSSERDIEFIAIPGRDGELIIDNKRYNAVTRSIPCILRLPKNKSVEHVISDISNWLNIDHQYHDFRWSGDPEFIYKAMFFQTFNMQRVIREFGRVVLNFKMHPIKYLKTGLEEFIISNNTTLHNPLSLPSKPIIKIVGQGSIKLKINDQEVDLRWLEEGGVIIDSENQTITTIDGNKSLSRHLYSYPFPVLEVGPNMITYEGDIENVSIIPRFGELI